MTYWGQIGLQEAFSPIMEELTFFHDFAMVVLIGILGLIASLMSSLAFTPWVDSQLLEAQEVESVWTVLPAIILVALALPSLVLLYMIEEGPLESDLTLKAVGHQWFWTYEYTDYLGWKGVTLDLEAYMAETEEQTFRLLDTAVRVTLPAECAISVMVTSEDVIHAWALPSLGVKADAIPGRLNQVSFFSHQCGTVFGQCSEICGANHSFMPICVELRPVQAFATWAMKATEGGGL